MDSTTQVSLLLVNLVFGLLIVLFTLRLLMRLMGVSGFNPMTQFVAKATNPVLAPFDKILPVIGHVDTAALTMAILLKSLELYAVTQILGGQSLSVMGLGLLGLVQVMSLVIELLFWGVIISVVLSWIAPDSRSPGAYLIRELIGPFLALFQRLLPPMGGLDLSPIVAIFVLKLVEILILAPIASLSVTL
jgi:YggT family protein